MRGASVKSIEKAQEEIVETLNELDDRLLQYQLLLEVASAMQPLGEEKRTEETLVRSCQARTWLSCSENRGRIHIEADSETLIVKGMIGLMIMILEGQELTEVATSSIDFIEKTDLKKRISVDRFHGMNSMISKIQDYARNHFSE